MAINKNWLPSSRHDQLQMANSWMRILQSESRPGATTTPADEWGIPAAVVTELGRLSSDADFALRTAISEQTRTPVASARCKTAFDALIAKMRDIKKRYFLVPPLADADLIGLGLKPRDNIPTASGTPTAQASVETYLVGRHQLGIKIVFVTGNPDDAANKSYRVWYSAIAPGETPPANPDVLSKAVSTKRRKDLIDFDYEDSGKTAYFAVQVENGKLKGPWGPMVPAVIP